MALIIDTHLIVKELIDAGASEKQAEVLVKRFVARDEVESLNNQLATKSDILKLESDISEFKSEVRSDISDLKSEIKSINTNIKWIITIGVLIVGILLKSTFKFIA